jgi:hypothetical protein
MTIIDEGKHLRAEVAKLRPDKRRRYSPELKRRILAWVGRAMAAGMDLPECGRSLGIKTWRFRTWQLEEAAGPVASSEVVALVPVEVEPFVAGGPTIVTPAGFRIEGLTVAQMAALLRELA